MKQPVPSIDSFFDIEAALKEYGFHIEDRDISSVASGVIYKQYGEIFIEFFQAFVNNIQSDMRVFYYKNNNKEVLFDGVAPTCQHDFDVLFQLLLPSDEFKGRLLTSWEERWM